MFLPASCVLLLAATAALAEDGAAAGAEAPWDGPHAAAPSDIIVTAPFARDRRDLLSGVAVMQGAELTQATRPTIGETLARTPGVSATSFGPNASRPVLRGLQGERVRVLTDGIGSIDVSNTSVDHAVVINPLLAERIEVLRGPESLLYGSSAIGGVVNVIDKRIPRAVPTEPIHVDATATYGSAANERSGGVAVDVPVTDTIVVHADGSYLKTGDLHIGGHVLSASARTTALANAGTEDANQLADGIDFAANATLKDTLPNSASRTWTAGVGVALITDTGDFGLSYGHYESLYDSPIRYAIAPGQAQEASSINLSQDRWDARAEIDTGGNILQKISARAAYASYRHFEVTRDGSAGTIYYNKGMEGRVELVQADHGPWKGASGVQYFSRDFNVVGDEAFLPKNSTEQLGLFTMQQLDFGTLKVEGGARFELTSVSGAPTPEQPQFRSGERDFKAFSFSAGASHGLGGDWRLGVNLMRAVRAPSAEELFANGLHGGAAEFEIGDLNFGLEKSWGVEAVLRGAGPGYHLEISVYQNWFGNYIYDSQTGAIRDGLPVFQSRQGKARFHGFEAQGDVTLAQFGAIKLVADGLADYVHATVVDEGPVPHIPPLRLLGGLGVQGTKVDARAEVEWSARQDRIQAFETPTDSFTIVNAEVNIRPWGAERPLSFALSANNIFDVVARRHASFLKDFAPLAGRDFRVTARAAF